MKIIQKILILLALGACAGATPKVREIKIAHPLPEDHAVHKAYQYFAERVNINSKGSFKVVIYPNGQLGTPSATIQLAQSGGLEIFHINVALLEDYAPIFALINLPYVFKDDAHYNAFMSSDIVRKEFDKLTNKGFIPLTYFDGGVRSFYNRLRPIKTPADMKGMKIRVQGNPTFIEMIRLMGGSPVAMAPSEIYTALQQGVIDGAENTEVTFLSQKHNEISKYFSRSQHQHASELMSMSSIYWDKLTSDEQQMFMKSAQEVRDKYAEIWSVSMDEAKEALIKYGTQFNDSDLDAFRAVVTPMHEAYKMKDPDYKAFFEAMKSFEK